MSISKYEILVKTVELGSLTAAAKLLGCTQSAASHAINALESESNLRIINRNRNGVSLTPDGQLLYPAIRDIVEAKGRFNELLAALQGGDTGCVRIGSFTSVAVHWLPGMIKTFCTAYPKIELQMLSGDYHDIAEWFSKDTIDVGFVTEKTNLAGCEYIPLKEDRLLAVLSKDHPLAGRDVISVTELENEPFISLLEASDQDARSVLEQAGITVDVKFTTKDDYAIIAMVAQGLGISILPELLLEGHPEVCTVPIEGGKKRTIGLAISPAGLISPSVQSFAQHVKNWVWERYSEEG